MPSLAARLLVDLLVAFGGRPPAKSSSSEDDELDEVLSDCQAAFCKAVRPFPVLPLLNPNNDLLSPSAGRSLTDFFSADRGFGLDERFTCSLLAKVLG